MENELSEGLRSFIKQYITSLEQLEILLLLCKEPERSWTVEQVFRITQSNLASVAERLKNLTSTGFLTREEKPSVTYRFQPGSPEIAGCITELQRAYATSKYKVVEAIFSAPLSPAQQFADSFKLKKKE